MRGIDPETGQYDDDTKHDVDAASWLGAGDRRKIFKGNARRGFSRVNN